MSARRYFRGAGCVAMQTVAFASLAAFLLQCVAAIVGIR